MQAPTNCLSVLGWKLVLPAVGLVLLSGACSDASGPGRGPMQGRYELVELFFAYNGDTVTLAADTVPGAYWWLEFYDDENVRGEGLLAFWTWPGVPRPDNDSIPLYLLSADPCQPAGCGPQLFDGVYLLYSTGEVELTFRRDYGGATWVPEMPWVVAAGEDGRDLLLVDEETERSTVQVKLVRTS